LPLLNDEKFLVRLQKRNHIQIPILVRLKHKLNQNDVLRVKISKGASFGEEFYVRLSKTGRMVVPQIIIEELNLNAGDILNVKLYRER